MQVLKNGLACMHPVTLQNGTDMLYVECQRELASPSLKEKGELFLSSLKRQSLGEANENQIHQQVMLNITTSR